jgi:hypothetical protein
VWNAQQIWGPSKIDTHGKTAKSAQRRTETAVAPMHTNKLHTSLYTDVLFVAGHTFLATVDSFFDFSIVTPIKSRTTEDLWNAIKAHTNVYTQYQVKIHEIISDDEGGVSACKLRLAQIGIQLNSKGKGEHVEIIERKLGTLKGKVRGLACTLPYRITIGLLKALVQYAVFFTNATPQFSKSVLKSPMERLTGQRLQYRHLRFGFGESVHVKRNLALL